MKILHYSDQNSPQFYNLYGQCDALFVTGDLTLFDFPGLADYSNPKPAFGVYGNHDSGQYFEELTIQNVHNRVVDFHGYLIGGFQGCIKYKNSSLLYTEEEAREWASTFPYVDILLLHAGPLGMLDDPTDDIHIGLQCIRDYVLQKKPKYVFVGHQYSNAELEIEEIKLYRTFGARIIEI